MRQSALRYHPGKPQGAAFVFFPVLLLPCQPCKVAWYIWELSPLELGGYLRLSGGANPPNTGLSNYCIVSTGAGYSLPLSHPSRHEVTLRMSANHIYLVWVQRAILISLEVHAANFNQSVVWLHVKLSMRCLNINMTAEPSKSEARTSWSWMWAKTKSCFHCFWTYPLHMCLLWSLINGSQLHSMLRKTRSVCETRMYFISAVWKASYNHQLASCSGVVTFFFNG